MALGLPSVEHGKCGARRCARLRSCPPQLGRGSPLRRGSALWQLASRAWGMQCLPRQRRGIATGQLSVSFRIGQHPRRNDASSGHDSKAFHHFSYTDCKSRNCFSTDLTSSVLGPAPSPVSAPFAFSVWAIARLTSLTSSCSSCIAALPPSFLSTPSALNAIVTFALRCAAGVSSAECALFHPERSKARCHCFLPRRYERHECRQHLLGRSLCLDCECFVRICRSQPVPSPFLLDFLHVVRSCFHPRLQCLKGFWREPEVC